MKHETEEWTDRAEGDWKVAQRDMQTADPVCNVVCFLAQQCAEKYLKAFLEEHNIAFPKTHDLIVLLNNTGGLLPELHKDRQALAYLGAFGIAARYPGPQANLQAAEDAIQAAGEVRTVIRAKLGLS